MKRWIALALVASSVAALALIGVKPMPSTPESAPALAKAESGTCALDAPWLTLGGERPKTSALMRFDVMRRRAGFGDETPFPADGVGPVPRGTEEKYTYRVGSKDRSGADQRRWASDPTSRREVRLLLTSCRAMTTWMGA